MRKLSKYEKETIINWNEAENLASVYAKEHGFQVVGAEEKIA